MGCFSGVLNVVSFGGFVCVDDVDGAAAQNSSLPRGDPSCAAPGRLLESCWNGEKAQISWCRSDRLRWLSMANSSLTAGTTPIEDQLEQHRAELRAYSYRMLGSPFEADDAVQETFIRAWRGYERFEGRAALRSWLYRIATNVCLDMLNGRERRARPMDLGPAREPIADNLNMLPEVTWIEPIPDGLVTPEGDPAEVTLARETIRLAFVAALQHLPPRQRAVLILCEVLRWKATEVAELLDTSVASVNSALQRARATLEASNVSAADTTPSLDKANAELLARYVEAFERYDMDALTSLIQEDATQSMPPYDLWLRGRDDIFAWWFGPGIGCAGSRVIPTVAANGAPAFGQYKPSESGSGFDPWALQVLEIADGRIVELTFFLDTARVFPLFGLPLRLES
jgi:RNA polymerase sigma-70 factor (ECF subfamily)